jgi:hypothetical protein
MFPHGPTADSRGFDGLMTSEIPLTCPHCGKTMAKSVEWVQQNTFFTCHFCGMPAMIDKDVAAQFLAEIELRQRH